MQTLKQKTVKELYKESRKLTIPNLLTMFRIVLIPVFIWIYHVQMNMTWAMMILIISGITDVLDGYIARKFNMMSDLGKFLDPLADKLTQAGILVCLSVRYPMMFLIFILLFIKETYAFYDGYITVQKTGVVQSAQWHGKMLTVMIYTMLMTHAFWLDLPQVLSFGMMMSCIIMLFISGILYHIRNVRLVKNKTTE